MRIGLIGAGALGTEVTLRMASDPSLLASLRLVLIIDPDTLDQRNVPLSRLYNRALRERGSVLLGQAKAEIAASSLSDCTFFDARRVQWMAHSVEVADVSWQHLRSLDLLISCTDNALARLETTLVARCLGLPLLDAGVLGETAEGGRVTWFSPDPQAACYLCGVSEDRRAALLAMAAALSLPCAVSTEAALGSNPVVSASLQQTADLLADELRGFVNAHAAPGRRRQNRESWAVKLSSTRTEGVWERERVTLRRSASCPWHAQMRLPLLSVDPDQSFQSALETVRMGLRVRLQFPWPIALLAACRRCGARDEQPRRVALLRRRGVCQRCGTPHQLEPLRSVASVGHNEPVAEMTPRQLGWADRQLLQLRPELAHATTFARASEER